MSDTAMSYGENKPGFFGTMWNGIKGAASTAWDYTGGAVWNGAKTLGNAASNWWNETGELKKAQDNREIVQLLVDSWDGNGSLESHLESFGFKGLVRHNGDILSYQRESGGFLGFGGNKQRIEVLTDGTVNVIEQETGFFNNFFGASDTYINGTKMNDGDVLLRNSGLALSVVDQSQVKKYFSEQAIQGTKYTFVQNGVGNDGLDVLDLNNSISKNIQHEINNADNFGGVVSVYNRSRLGGFFGDAGNVIASLASQAFGFGGTERAYGTWRSILNSGVLQNGGAIFAHSQGAQIVTHALRDYYGTMQTKTETNLFVFGGAHTLKPVQAVQAMYDLRTAPDFITGVIHHIGDVFNWKSTAAENGKYEVINHMAFEQVDGMRREPFGSGKSYRDVPGKVDQLKWNWDANGADNHVFMNAYQDSFNYMNSRNVQYMR
jgi:hypothetical protein